MTRLLTYDFKNSYLSTSYVLFVEKNISKREKNTYKYFEKEALW
jgi:hypothetical protein